MFRIMTTLVALTAFGGFAQAQRTLPLSPGIQPGASFGPGLQYLPLTTPRFIAPNHGFGGTALRFGPGYNFNRGFGYGGFGYSGFGFGGFSYLPYGYAGYGYGYPTYGYSSNYGPNATAGIPLPQASPGIALANEFPAVLTLRFPAAAEVWLNGERMPGEPGQERVLTSPVLKPGGHYTFDVIARWTTGGKTFEAKRAITIDSGDRSRLSILSGTEVRK